MKVISCFLTEERRPFSFDFLLDLKFLFLKLLEVSRLVPVFSNLQRLEIHSYWALSL